MLRYLAASMAMVLGMSVVGMAASREEEAKKAAEHLQSKDAKTRLEGLKSLAELGGASKKLAAPYVTQITSLLSDKEANVRGKAADTLAKIDPEDKKAAITRIAGTLKDEGNMYARMDMEFALGMLGGESEEADLKKLALEALNAARDKATEKREQKIIQAARMTITGAKKKKN